MIRREELAKIGQFKKPHGIKGEISFTFTDSSFDENECPFFVCELDGIFVPFHIEDYRFITADSGILSLKNLDSDSKVRVLSHKEIYFPKKHLTENNSDDVYTWNFFIGFTLIDERQGKIGRITDIEEAALNVLFVVETEKEEILIPAVDEIITHINEEQKELFVDLPEGLLAL